VVVIKIVLGDDEQIRRELHTLREARKLGNPHLIHTFAYYKYDGLVTPHQFMFPKAEHVNLWDFVCAWHPKPPREKSGYLEQLFKQIQGLADAVSALHVINVRHGDLKLENILCFQTKDGVPSGRIGSKPGFKCTKDDCRVRFVITDFGLGRHHQSATQVRNSTDTKVSTKRYSGPEMELLPAADFGLSRQFDIWSLGAVFFELVIWLVQGTTSLDAFTQETKDESFYAVKEKLNLFPDSRDSKKRPRGTAVVNAKVLKKHDDLTEDPLCADTEPIKAFIDLIFESMLVIEPGNADYGKRTDAGTWLGTGSGVSDPKIHITRADTITFNEKLETAPTRSEANKVADKTREILQNCKDLDVSLPPQTEGSSRTLVLVGYPNNERKTL
jgi:serine/threonine protein kinase